MTCTISGLSQSTQVTWIDPDNVEISDSDTNNYVIDQGSFVFGNKASTLIIKTAKLGVLSSGDVFKCKLKSALYPDDSPDVVKQMTLTVLSLGKNVHARMKYIFIVLPFMSLTQPIVGFCQCIIRLTK